nr:retrovirus-related Pol polyprotein from transposon TNT 1-94 [Tanacetum cinerariifolium]
MTKTSQEHAMHAIGTKWVYRNKKDERGVVVRNKARLVAQGYTQKKGIDYDEVFAPVARIEAIMLFLAYASFMGFIVYQMDIKSAFLYDTIEEEVYVCQPPGFEYLHFPDKVYKVEKPYMVSIKLPESVKTTSTLIETNKELLKDEEAEDVDVHLYRSMIGSLMYLIASRPDIMFVICAYARFQVSPKVLHIHAVKRIFRYLKGQPKLGLWYPKDSPFDLEAFSDSDYAGAMMNLELKLVVAKVSTAKQKLVLNGCLDWNETIANDEIQVSVVGLTYYWVKNVNGEAQIQALVDKKKIIIIEASIKRDLRFEDEGGVDCLSNEVIFEQLALMGSTMASAIICLATNQKFNFSKYIFDNMVKHLDGGVKFLMYPRFVQVFLDNQVEGMDRNNVIFVISSHIKKVFTNMKREGKDFSRKVTPLFQSMMVQAPEDMGEGLKRLRKVGLARRVESLTEASLGDQDASKQERMIDNINQDMEITLVDDTQGRMNEKYMFKVNDIDGNEVVVGVAASEKVEQSVKVIEKEVSTADLVTTTGEVVTTAGIKVTTAATTPQISKDELTLA